MTQMCEENGALIRIAKCICGSNINWVAQCVFKWKNVLIGTISLGTIKSAGFSTISLAIRVNRFLFQENIIAFQLETDDKLTTVHNS